MPSEPKNRDLPRQPDDLDFDSRRWWPGVAAVVSLAVVLVHSVLWWLYYRPAPKVLWGDEVTYLDSATRLLAGDAGWWPEPLWPPLYPQFLAGLTWLGGGSLLLVQLAQSCLLVVTAMLLFDLARSFSGSRAAGFAAAALTLCYPPLVAFTHYLWPEVIHLFLFVALLWVLISRWTKLSWCALAGVILGLALLTKSLLLPFVPVLLAAAAWGARPAAVALRIALVLILTAATVAPTVVSNARRVGTPMIAGSAAFNLWVGLNDVGREHFRYEVVWSEYERWIASGSTYAERQNLLEDKIRRMIRDRGIVAVVQGQLDKQYFRLFDASCYLTDQLPGGPAAERIGVGYLQTGGRLAGGVRTMSVAAILLLTVLAPLGFLLGGWRGHRWVRVLLAFFAYNLLLFLFLHVKTRYRIQMLPTAFVGVGCLVAWFEAGCRPRPGWGRVAAAAVVVALLLWFALG